MKSFIFLVMFLVLQAGLLFAGERQIMFGGQPYYLEEGSGPTILLSIPRGTVATGSTGPNGDINLVPSAPPIGVDLAPSFGESPDLFINRIMPLQEESFNPRLP